QSSDPPYQVLSYTLSGVRVLTDHAKGDSEASEDRGVNLQTGFLKITKYRNSSSATPLSTLLTACNAPQRASRRSASTDRLSSVGLSNSLFVGRITNSVNGITLPRRAPATSHQNVAPLSHATMEDS